MKRKSYQPVTGLRKCKECCDWFTAVDDRHVFCSDECVRISGARRLSASVQRVPSYLYVLHWHDIGLIKIGSSTRNPGPVSSARAHLRKKGIEAPDGVQIWWSLGTCREEAFLQASIAYVYPEAFISTRLSEWFTTADATADDIVRSLNKAFLPAKTWMESHEQT